MTGGILETQADALLERLRSGQESRCAERREAAQQRAREVVQTAYADNRARLHQVAEELRRERRHRELVEQAREQSHRRERRQQLARESLAEGWEMLCTVLRRRWEDPERRRAWVDALLERAVVELPAATWHVDYPSDWSADERTALARTIEEKTGAAPAFSSDEALQAGLRFRAGGLSLDAGVGPSEHGLLAGRSRIEARFLHHLETHRAENGESGGSA